MPMPPRGKSILQTQDPYHTPGYGGFCPQFKYRIGNTFGQTTHNLLEDANVASSSRLVLAQLFPDDAGASQAAEARTALLQSRDQSWGDQKLVETLVPGYTGFIPRSQHYFGNRYANVCKNSVSDFELDQRKQQAKHKELAQIEAAQAGRTEGLDPQILPKIQTKQTTPLRAVADEPATFISKSAPPPVISPYFQDNDSDQKKYMSGYTGFVPRSRGRLGEGYPIITHKSLNEFTDDCARQREVARHTISVEMPPAAAKDTRKIYPSESGLVPHYTGHIPVQKFRFGKTFGNSTQDALRKSLPPVTA